MRSHKSINYAVLAGRPQEENRSRQYCEESRKNAEAGEALQRRASEVVNALLGNGGCWCTDIEPDGLCLAPVLRAMAAMGTGRDQSQEAMLDVMVPALKRSGFADVVVSRFLLNGSEYNSPEGGKVSDAALSVASGVFGVPTVVVTVSCSEPVVEVVRPQGNRLFDKCATDQVLVAVLTTDGTSEGTNHYAAAGAVSVPRDASVVEFVQALCGTPVRCVVLLDCRGPTTHSPALFLSRTPGWMCWCRGPNRRGG